MPMSHGSVALLGWYFSGGAAQCLGGSSNFGSMIEHALLYRVPRGSPKIRREDVTARPTSGSRGKNSQSWTPDEDRLSRLGRAARQLRRVQEHDPFALEILSLLYSDEAARWARTKWGSLAVLIRLTPTGKSLLKKARKRQRGAQLAITEAQLAENMVQGPTLDFTHSVLIARAMREAAELEEYAAKVWNSTDLRAQAPSETGARIPAVEGLCEAAE
jgi:hypothetical protein